MLASGSFTHDLSQFRSGVPGEEPAWVSDFAGWFNAALAGHRTDEHLLPLYVALGAGGIDAPVAHLHDSTTFGVLRMDAYAFG